MFWRKKYQGFFVASTQTCPVLRVEICYFSDFPRLLVSKLCIASTGLLVTTEPKNAGKIVNRKLTLYKISWLPLGFCVFFVSQNFRELKFRSFLETSLQWRYLFVDYKTATGLVSMKNVSFFVVASFPTCRVLRAGNTRVCLLKRLVPAFFKSLKPDC